MSQRSRWNLDPATGRPVLAGQRSPIIVPGNGPAPSAAAAMPTELLIGENMGTVLFLVKVGDNYLSMPMTIHEARKHISIVADAIQRAEESLCPAESPATAPADCQAPAGTMTTIGTHEIETRPDSTVRIAGDGCGR